MATEEILCENSQVPEFLNSCEIYEISWHSEVLKGNEYISDFLSPYLCDSELMSLICEDSLKLECSLNSEEPMRIGYSISDQSCECSLNNEEPIGLFSLQEGKWSDWLRVICFVFKTVVPKHRFCKLQNVWNVCEFGSDYMAPWVNIIDSLDMTLSYIGGIYS